jgi:hypothetical protein
MASSEENLIDPADLKMTSRELWEKGNQLLQSLANGGSVDVPEGDLDPITRKAQAYFQRSIIVDDDE